MTHSAENDAPLWVVTELDLSLPTPPPWGEPHPEEAPVGPFESREAADDWAFAYVGQFGGSGSWSIAPLRVPPRPIPPAGGDTFLSALLSDQRTTWEERHGVIPPAKTP